MPRVSLRRLNPDERPHAPGYLVAPERVEPRLGHGAVSAAADLRHTERLQTAARQRNQIAQKFSRPAGNGFEGRRRTGISAGKCFEHICTDFKLLRANRGVRFSLVYPPYSALVWRDFAQRRQVDVSLDFKRYVFDTVHALPNVALYDFQPRLEWVANLDNYKDIYHFSPAISRAMLEAIAEGTNQVTWTTIAASEQVLRQVATTARGR